MKALEGDVDKKSSEKVKGVNDQANKFAEDFNKVFNQIEKIKEDLNSLTEQVAEHELMTNPRGFMRRESIILNEDGFKSVDGGSDPEAIEEVDEDSDTETRYA